MREVLIPAWIFDHYGDYFMIGIEPSGRVRIDGGHSTKQGVVDAKELHRSISAIAAPRDTLWAMVKIERIPERKARVNRRAIKTLNKVTRPTPGGAA
jgi:hypothetical protein